MKVLNNATITDVPGFLAAGIHCGIKKSGKKDLCIIYSEYPSVAAATFTTNKVKAAPILVNMEHIKSEYIRAVVVNSGVANACTGEKGIDDAYEMAQITSKEFNVKKNEVIVASTGVIGTYLPMDIIKSGIKKASACISKNGGLDAAEAIMTTDTFIKKCTVEIEIDNKKVLISGIAKGSGMIHPNMATMLSFVVTNANISKSMLTKALKESVNDSYNMISVDGDTSTNDMVLVLANGQAGNEIIDSQDKNYIEFKKALHYVNCELAKQIAKDGEGATKLIEVCVNNAKTIEDAKVLAKSVIKSSLVKAAFFGSDANWGRIICSLGYSGADFKPENVSISFKGQKDEICIVENGMGTVFDEGEAKKILDENYIKVIINLKDGEYNAKAWGCDLSYDYVKINGSYRS
ncbi:bifunctional ornithine acetyltransferase/N-acetylglutamate synthase [Caloramator sp. E03]|uniref:bifunctional ornithine acetyltransferase/N-acetylglutamate synthase n=1 Tax=Caloramator sp. E03 TaxID=2576307 RepID=UPI0011104296|nr:bifunctional ornithine acetyltransferase/N-acetylglutamate synthase [Caloramator sp. E03]QCX34437.1 bifunctional ornithine acetyltransferase/N-acetylglutamate synthase [Caloramator sp. E03]